MNDPTREANALLLPLARAALAWRDNFAVPAVLGGKTRSQILCDTIDALPEDLKARLRDGA